MIDILREYLNLKKVITVGLAFSFQELKTFLEINLIKN